MKFISRIFPFIAQPFLNECSASHAWKSYSYLKTFLLYFKSNIINSHRHHFSFFCRGVVNSIDVEAKGPLTATNRWYTGFHLGLMTQRLRAVVLDFSTNRKTPKKAFTVPTLSILYSVTFENKRSACYRRSLICTVCILLNWILKSLYIFVSEILYKCTVWKEKFTDKKINHHTWKMARATHSDGIEEVRCFDVLSAFCVGGTCKYFMRHNLFIPLVLSSQSIWT